MMKKFLIIFLLWEISLTARPQEMFPVWAKSLGGPGWDIANTMCITSSGDVVVSGTFADSIDMNDQRYYSNGLADVLVAKYNQNGESLGGFTFGGAGYDLPILSVYDQSMVLVTRFYNPMKVQGKQIDSTGTINYMVGWFDDSGKILYSHTISTGKKLEITDLETDQKGTIYLSGWYSDTLRVDGRDIGISTKEEPLFLSLQANDKFQGMKTPNGLKERQVFACTPNDGNSMTIAGITTDGNDKDLANPDVVYHTLFTANLNHAGKTSDMKELLRGVELQPVSVAKARQCTWIVSRFKHYCMNGADTLKGKGQDEIILAKIPDKKEDVQLWTIGGYANDKPLALKASGNQAVLIGSYSDTIWFGENNLMVSNEKGSDLFIAVFEDDKIPVKTISLGGLYNDFPCAVSTSEAGVYVLGQFRDTLYVGGSKLATEGSYDLFVARLENCGAKTPVEIFATAVTDAKGNTGYQLSVKESYTSYQWSDGLGFGTTINVDKAKKYSIEAIDPFGCKCTGEINLANLKSALIGQEGSPLSNSLQAEFKLYPTVTQGIIYWQPGNKFPVTGATLRITDAKGSTYITREYPVALSPLSVQTLDMGQLVPGQYLVRITGEGFKESVKVIVK